MLDDPDSSQSLTPRQVVALLLALTLGVALGAVISHRTHRLLDAQEEADRASREAQDEPKARRPQPDPFGTLDRRWWLGGKSACPEGSTLKARPTAYGLLLACVGADGRNQGMWSQWDYGQQMVSWQQAGRWHGTWQTWTNDGVLIESGQHRDDRREGAWRYFNEAGELLRTDYYEHGQLRRSEPASGEPLP